MDTDSEGNHFASKRIDFVRANSSPESLHVPFLAGLIRVHRRPSAVPTELFGLKGTIHLRDLTLRRSTAAARARCCDLSGTVLWPRVWGAPCSAARLAFRKADLHDGFALPKEFDCVRKSPTQDCPETSVRHVPTPEPQDLWRRAEPTCEIDEILVLREHYDLRLTSLIEDLRVFCLAQAHVANVHRI